MSIKTILEELKMTIRHPSSGMVEIFVNPTRQELRGFKIIRWAIKKNKVYAWSGNFLHHQVLPKFSNYVNFTENDGFVTGAIYSIMAAPGWKFESDMFAGYSYMSRAEKIRRIKEINWKTADKYLPGISNWANELLEKLKNKKKK